MGVLFLSSSFTTDPIAGSKKLCFSTLGCPDWSLDEIISFAVKHKYEGIEIRTIQRELDLTKVPAFSPANAKATVRRFKDANLKIIDLGSSAAMHHRDATTRKKNLDDAKNYIDLAATLDIPYVRVFPNNLPKDSSRQSVLELITTGLDELAGHAKNTNVKILMESHGDLVSKNDLVYVMEHVNNKKVGLIWDILNAWSVTKEPPADVYASISKYVHHVHIKDGLLKDGKVLYTLLGKGEAPMREAVQLLYKNNYQGYYSFEWEKLWHPEIEAPEVAIAQFPSEILTYFS
jgi:sugar phosphate isomerase/epimerase